jgi:hypothetical protein
MYRSANLSPPGGTSHMSLITGRVFPLIVVADQLGLSSGPQFVNADNIDAGVLGPGVVGALPSNVQPRT